MSSVRLNIRPLDRFAKKVASNGGPMRDVFIKWGGRYQAFARQRFATFSRGGGDWPDLADVTKKARAKAKKAAAGHKGARKFSILRDTDTLYNALDSEIEGAGSLKQVIKHGIRVGFGGSDKHPKGQITIAELAAVHHFGRGRVPARPIIVEPDRETMRRMAHDLTVGLKRMETWVR